MVMNQLHRKVNTMFTNNDIYYIYNIFILQDIYTPLYIYIYIMYHIYYNID